ncbi:FkbM family methyltransferase [Fluviicola sp.]|uniref:FkbM family methyltransferase n=1 Tax=Fluviicola sp. TaxID=1917219 RepID=UPI003D2DE379
MKKKIRLFIQNKLGYWFYKSKHLPIGTDIGVDLSRKLIFPIKTIVDIGANIGQSALYYRDLFPESTIYCYEPIPAIYEQLKHLTGNDPAIHPFQYGVGATKGELQIVLLEDQLSQQHSFHKVAGDSDKTISVPITTIDEIVENNKLETIDLLKIDTEGFEIEVIEGATKSISSNKIKAVYLEVGLSSKNEHNTPFIKVLDALEKVGFTFYGLYEISHIGIQSNYHYGNVLFIHQSVLDQIANWQLDS